MATSRRHILAGSAALTAVLAGTLAGHAQRAAPRAEASLTGDELTALHTADEGVEDRFLGSPDARLVCIEYASLTCPHCASFHNEVLPQLKSRFIDTGQVRFVFRHFLLTQQDAGASLMARAAPAERFFPLLDVLFRQQRSWATARDPVAALRRIGLEFGFTQESFQASLQNQQLLDRLISQRDRAEQRFGVDSTPTLFVNGQKYPGALRVEEFESVVAPMLRG